MPARFMRRFLAAVTPLTIELALKALTSLEERDQSIGAQWRRRIERARHEADLAERRYEAVDPANRQLEQANMADAVAPARAVYEFQKKFKDQVAIQGGVFEGVFKNKDDMLSLASIPSQQVLYGMLVNVIHSPIRGLVMVLDQISKKTA